MLCRRLACLAVVVMLPVSSLAQTAGLFPAVRQLQDAPPSLADAIRQEATRRPRDGGRPLPLAAHWNVTGMHNEGFTPAYQLQLLKNGHHILPWLEYPPTDWALDRLFKPGDPRRQKYIESRLKEFETNIKELARQRLPISFLATQWESILTYDKEFFGLPAEKNPNVIGIDGKVMGKVCPFGPVEPWREAGKIWTANSFMKRLQEWYPDPPLVLFISNNEHARQQWSEVEQSKRYLDKFGKGKSDVFKRKVVGDGWIERYGAMLDSMRAGLTNKTWRKNARFIGYEAFPPVHFGRWGGWKEYALTIPGRLDPQPLVWDGGSPSYYLHNGMAITDYTVWSPQIETMNWVFMLDEIHKTRPDFWFELSTWDGDQPGAGNNKRKFYAKLGEPFTPARYEGMVQYGMWLMRPRVVREFRGHTEAVEYAGPYFDAILRAVDRVWSEPILQRFWRDGTLVVNPKGKHPFQADIPAEYKDAQRWFLLDTNLTPKELRPEEFDNARPPARQLEIPVFALALVMGKAPEREWLIYAHSPRYARTHVAITLPGFGPITVDVPQSGSFFRLTEKDKKLQTVIQGGPASFRIEAPRFVEIGALASFAVAEKYAPSNGKIGGLTWNFDDGTEAQGDKATHRFAKAGQYLVTVTAAVDGPASVRKEVHHQQVPVFVGMTPESGIACRLLMKGALKEGMKSWIWHGGWDKVDYTFVPDVSGANNLGFLAGGKWAADALRGLVLELDGEHDRVEIMNGPGINAGKAYPKRTVAFWFRAREHLDAKQKPLRQVLYEEGGSGSGLNVYLEGETLFAGSWSNNKGAWLKAETVKCNDWHHVAIVLRTAGKDDAPATVTLYIDGEKAGQHDAPLLGAHTGDVNLGRSGSTRFHDRADDNPGYYFAGRLDDFRILNRSLTPEEARAMVHGKDQPGKD
jgi:hypothetical protein